MWFCAQAGEESSSQQEQEERLPDLPLLSEQLLLDELWDMLGECLKELEESHDQHAVLGIFFLIYKRCFGIKRATSYFTHLSVFL